MARRFARGRSGPLPGEGIGTMPLWKSVCASTCIPEPKLSDQFHLFLFVIQKAVIHFFCSPVCVSSSTKPNQTLPRFRIAFRSLKGPPPLPGSRGPGRGLSSRSGASPPAGSAGGTMPRAAVRGPAYPPRRSSAVPPLRGCFRLDLCPKRLW